MSHLSASFSATIRVRLADAPGLVRAGSRRRSATRAARSARSTSSASRASTKVRDVTVARRRRRPPRADRRGRARASTGVEVEHVSDRDVPRSTSAASSRWRRKSPLKTRDDLSMAYTPGVARDLHARSPSDPRRAWNLTIKQNTVAVVSDGTAVLGLGDIGPGGGDAGDGGQGDAVQGVRRRRRLADLPRDEGRRRDRRRRAPRSRRASAGSTSRTSPRRAASRSSAACARSLDIPVFHDDQHGTAIVVLAALLNALNGRRQARSRTCAIVMTGVGRGRHRGDGHPARGGRRATSIGCDRAGRALPGRAGPQRRSKAAFAERTNPDGRRGARRRGPAPAPTSTSGCRGPGAVSRRRGRPRWRDDAIVFAMANPTPEMPPEAIDGPRRGRRDGPLRLPEPDQQRARVPGRLPRRARRARVARSRRG